MTKIFLGIFIFFSLWVTQALATATVMPATGGVAISADATGGTYTSLTGPIISEGATGDIGGNGNLPGTVIVNAPSGFIFDTGGTAPTVLVTRTAGSGGQGLNINSVVSGTSVAITSMTTTQITFTVTGATQNTVQNSLTWQNVRVRPSTGTPLASGNITSSGTLTITGVTNGITNFGTLTEVVGAKNKLVYATQPSATATTGVDFVTKPIIALQDQFGNTVTSDNTTTVNSTPVLSTQVCGGTAGFGTFTSTPASGAAVTNGVMTYTAMQYSFGESIKICATSAGIISALSNTVVVSNPIPTTTSISPTSKTAGSGAFTLTVNGTNFVSVSIAQFNGSNRTTTYLSSTQLTASILASDITATGTFPIIVSNPVPGGGLSNSQTFTVNPIPLGFSLANSGDKSVTQGNSATSTIIATFISGASQSVSFSASGLPSGASASFLPTSCTPTCSTALIVTASASAALGNSTVTITGNDGTNLTTTTFVLTVNAAPLPPPPSSPSGPSSVPTNVNSSAPSSAYLYGQAYPGSKIEVLRRSEVVGQYESVPLILASVQDDGTFQVSIINFLQAGYFFAIRATDKDGRQSRILPLISQFVTSGSNLILKDIFVPPTIDVALGAVPQGEPLKILGYAAPSSTVEVSIDDATQYQTTADASGFYTFTTSTTSFSLDNHTIKARFVLPSGAKSDFSFQRVFKVSLLAFPKTDLNADGVVDISDWSIFLFRWGSSDATLRKSIDFNNDGKVDVSDFSIFLASMRMK